MTGAVQHREELLKIAYCGHSYHQTTKSTEFLESALRGLGQVDSYWDEESAQEGSPASS